MTRARRGRAWQAPGNRPARRAATRGACGVETATSDVVHALIVGREITGLSAFT